MHVVGEVVLGGTGWKVVDRRCVLLENNVWDFDFIGEVIGSVIDMNVESLDVLLNGKFRFLGKMIMESDWF